ncbi:Alpha/Beta hydrolase protein [Blastocladiella britannica]|nr:Alpha/Beta hydrolase protein [Blastocladiella britannica]
MADILSKLPPSAQNLALRALGIIITLRSQGIPRPSTRILVAAALVASAYVALRHHRAKAAAWELRRRELLASPAFVQRHTAYVTVRGKSLRVLKVGVAAAATVSSRPASPTAIAASGGRSNPAGLGLAPAGLASRESVSSDSWSDAGRTHTTTTTKTTSASRPSSRASAGSGSGSDLDDMRDGHDDDDATPRGAVASIRTVPTLVFVHGFGGGINQWAPLLELCAKTAPVVAIDAVGHGMSPDTHRPEDYATLSMVEDLRHAIAKLAPTGPLVIVAHSYGCCLSAHLAASADTDRVVAGRIGAMAFLTPKALMTPKEAHSALAQAGMASPLLTLFRLWDRRGGPFSTSVGRYVGPSATVADRWRQLAWNMHLTNQQVQSIYKGMAWATPATYAAIRVPMLLLGGACDIVTPAEPNLAKLCELLTNAPHPDPIIYPAVAHQLMLEATGPLHADLAAFLATWAGFTAFDSKHVAEVKRKVEPSENKWSMKNYAKWVAAMPVGNRVGGVHQLRGMKVLRQTDDHHSPELFRATYPRVGLVVDISKDTPSYDPRSLQLPSSTSPRCLYRKVPTVSKIPPTREDVADFLRTLRDFWASADPESAEVAVHCHYGFNRTGFMTVCFLVEMERMPVAEAVALVASARPPGIRHQHFLDELYLRYAPRQRVRSLTNGSTRRPSIAVGAAKPSSAPAATAAATPSSATQSAAAVPLPPSPTKPLVSRESR